MDRPASDHSKPNSPPISWLDHFFLKIESLAYHRPWQVLIVCVVMAGLSLWYTANNLEFNTSRRDLIAKDLPYETLYERYRELFKDFDGLTVVVEGDKPEPMKRFTEALALKLKSLPHLFSEIFYKVDIEYFKDKVLLYMSPDELEDLIDKLESHQTFLETINASPGLNQILQAINHEISSGMVDSLMSGFLGTESEKEEGTDDQADLQLLITLFKAMHAQLKGDTVYRSPWRSLFTDSEESLQEEGYLVSDDERLLFILMSPKEDQNDFAGSKGAIQSVRDLIAELKTEYPEIQVGVTGGDVIASDEMVATKDDVTHASILALVGVAVLFIGIYRGVVRPLLAVFCLLVALGWSMGYTTLVVGHLNILTVVFTTILIGLGIDFGIHVIERYREERAGEKSVLEALEKTLRGTGRGNLAGAITTAIAFGAMTLTDFLGIAELGWIAGGGILLCLLAMILLLPALIMIEERLFPNKKPKPVAVHRARVSIESCFEHYRMIIGISLFATVLAGIAFKNLQFDYNLLNLQVKETEAVEYELKILENAKRSTWYAAIISDSYADALKKLQQVKSIPSVGKVESILSVLPEHQEENLKLIPDLQPLLGDMEIEPDDELFSLQRLKKTLKKIRFKLRGRESGKEDEVAETGRWAQKVIEAIENQDPASAKTRLQNFSRNLTQDYRDKLESLRKGLKAEKVKVENLPKDLKSRFMSTQGHFLILAFPNINIWERESMEQFLASMREIDPDVTGNAVHMFESSQLMKMGYLTGGLYAMCAIILFLFLSFKRPGTVLLILLPTWIGTVWTVGIMELTGVRFNLANLVILPLIIGIGVVNGIHIVHRFREEGGKEDTVLSKSTGQAVILSSLTTMIGFGSLMVANHQGIFSLGLVLTLGVGNSLLASITLLPALLKMCTVRQWRV